MKQKLIALVCALALTLSLAGCVFSTPESVGKLGEVEITSGLYLLAQFDAYQQAAQLASEEQDATNVKAFLKQTITVDAESGETALVSDYVADKTMESLQLYAAVETRFDELGGELNDVQAAQADSYAQQLMDQYGDTYTANGIGLETLKRYERILLKSSLLLDMVYGADGETPISDAELTDHIENQMYMLCYAIIPLYDMNTFAFADEEQSAQMLALAQNAADTYNSDPAHGQTAAEQAAAFSAQADAALPEIYAVMGGTYDPESSGMQTDLLTEDTIGSAFTEEGAADAVRTLKLGEAAAVKYTSYAILLAVRLDPLEVSTLDELRGDALNDLASSKLSDALADHGSGLTDSLDRSAMQKFPASKIVAA